MPLDYEGYYINLERSADRRAAMEEQFARFGLAGRYERFAAIDGATLPAEGELTANVRGCFLSHLSALKQARGDGACVHILEDDVLLSPHVAPGLELLAQSGALDEWDVIYTEVMVPLEVRVIREMRLMLQESVQVAVDGKTRSIKKLLMVDLYGRIFAGMTSYLVAGRAREKLIGLLEGYVAEGPKFAIDICMKKLVLEKKIRAACAFPFLTSIDLRLNADSTTGIVDRKARAVLASNILRHTFFVDCDWETCRRLIETQVRPATDTGVHENMLGALLAFGISRQNVAF